MRAKPVVLLIVALGCGMIAAVAASKAVLNQGPTGVEDTVEIFVAVKDLPHAQQISAENVKLDKWPRSRLPEGALVKLDQLENKFTKQFIFAGEPILDRKLADSRESFSTGIPPGFRIFNIAGGSSVYIKPGDHVDILGTFQLGGRNAAMESATVMRNVKVHGINGITTRDSDEKTASKNTTFQLLVKESQLETLTLAHKLGELQLNLRPFGEQEDEGSPDNGDAFRNWISENDQRAAPPSVLTSITGPLASEPAAKVATHEMAIITPNGVVRWRWDEGNSLPTLVDENLINSESNAGSLNSEDSGDASANVSSGYGGYPPTYPSSDDESQLTGDDEESEDRPGVLQRRR